MDALDPGLVGDEDHFDALGLPAQRHDVPTFALDFAEAQTDRLAVNQGDFGGVPTKRVENDRDKFVWPEFGRVVA